MSNDENKYNSKDISDINLEDEDNSEIVNVKPKGFITHSKGDAKSYHEPNKDSDIKIEDTVSGSVTYKYQGLMKNNQETVENETKDSDLSLEDVCDISAVTISENKTAIQYDTIDNPENNENNHLNDNDLSLETLNYARADDDGEERVHIKEDMYSDCISVDDSDEEITAREVTKSKETIQGEKKDAKFVTEEDLENSSKCNLLYNKGNKVGNHPSKRETDTDEKDQESGDYFRNITTNDKIEYSKEPERNSGKIAYINNDLCQDNEIVVPITELNLVDMIEVEESNNTKRKEEGGNEEIENKLFKERSNITDEGVYYDRVKEADACGNKIKDRRKSEKSTE